MTGQLLVRLQVGHFSHLLVPKLPNGHTHLYTVFVRAQDGEQFKDCSIIEKVKFHRYSDSDLEVTKPPFLKSETLDPESKYRTNTYEMSIWMDGKKYDFDYKLSHSMEQSETLFTTATFYISESTPEFDLIANAYGADKFVRNGEERFIGLPGIYRSHSLDSFYLQHSVPKKPRIDREDYFPLLALPNEIISNIFSFLSIEDRFKARVNRRLDEIELESKYFVERVHLSESSVNDPSAIRGYYAGDQEIKFFDEKSYSPDCIRRIAKNCSIGVLEMELTGLDRLDLIKELVMDNLFIDLEHDVSHGRPTSDNDCFLIHFARKCQFISISNFTNFSPEAIHAACKIMMNDSTKIDTLTLSESVTKENFVSFFNLIGVYFQNGRFFSSREAEVYAENEEERISIFDGHLQYDVDKSDFYGPPGDLASIFVNLHATRESLDEAKEVGEGYYRIA